MQMIFIISIIFLVLLFASSIVFHFTLRSKNKRLSQLLKENEFLVSEANHRIKNNLQLIVSLLARETRKTSNWDVDSLKNITTQIEAFSILHQQLYINNEKNTINLSVYLNDLCSNLQSVLEANNIQLKRDIEMVSFDITRAVYVGLLLNELIINSVKHAFSESHYHKQISVSLIKDNGRIQLIYHDNGKGLIQNEHPQLIHLLCQQLKTNFTIKNQNGFNFEISLKH